MNIDIIHRGVSFDGHKGSFSTAVDKRLNWLLAGWANYFNYGTLSKVYCRTDRYVEDRVRRFLRKRHKIAGQGFRRFAHDVIYGELGVVCLMNLKKDQLACPA